mgnify:CR=1 FL=1
MKLIERVNKSLYDKGYLIVEYRKITKKDRTKGNKKYKYVVFIIDSKNTYAIAEYVPKHLRGKKLNEFVDLTISMFNQQKEWESQPIR